MQSFMIIQRIVFLYCVEIEKRYHVIGIVPKLKHSIYSCDKPQPYSVIMVVKSVKYIPISQSIKVRFVVPHRNKLWAEKLRFKIQYPVSCEEINQTDLNYCSTKDHINTIKYLFYGKI